MKNMPKKIYLQWNDQNVESLEELEEIVGEIDFNDLHRDGVTWSEERIFNTDLEYELKLKQ